MLLIANRGADLCWALGGIICNFIPILPYFQHWGDEPRPRFCSGEQIKWRPKKGFHQKWNTFFPKFRQRTKKKIFTKNGVLFPQIQVKTKKTRSSPKLANFFSPNSSGHLRSDAHQSRIIGGRGCRCRPYLNYWGGYSQIVGGDMFPPPPPGFGTPDRERLCHLFVGKIP